MIREEYDFTNMADYLYGNIDLLISGFPKSEERSSYFYSIWKEKGKDILLLERTNNDTINYTYIAKSYLSKQGELDSTTDISYLLRRFNIIQKNILLDLCSLDHILIMFLTKILLTQVIPKSLFTAYIRPTYYCNQSENIGFSLCDQVLGVKSVPGFIKREEKEQTLCSFIGFEGVRLKSVLESVYNIQHLIPIVAFPSGSPQWYNITMWNSMDILQSETPDFTIRKCSSESIFEAVDLLNSCIKADEHVVLAPLGTRPHSMACAIFACKHNNVRIIYDYVIERENRTKGISNIIIYHLSSFLNT